MTYKTQNWTLFAATEATECLDQLQSNTSDIILAALHFPVDDEYTHVRQGIVVGEYNMEITSAYNATVGSEENVDIIDTFNSIGPELWVLILAFLAAIGGLIVVSVVLKTSSRKRSKRLFLDRDGALEAILSKNRRKHRKKEISNLLWQTFDKIWMGMLNKDESLAQPQTRMNQPWSAAILRVSLCFFLIWLTFYFTSMVRTELVTVKSPEQINSYQDVLDKKGLLPEFIATATDHHVFMNAPKESNEGKIWTLVERQPGGYEASLKKGTQFIEELHKIFFLKKVLLASRERSYIVLPLSCKIRIAYFEKEEPELSHMRIWTKGDPLSTAVLRGFAFNVAFEDKSVRKGLQSAFERGLEKAMFLKVSLNILRDPMVFGLWEDPSTIDKKHECLGENAPKPLPTIYQPSISNYKKLFFFQFFMGLIASLFILIFEFGISKIKKIVQLNRMKKLNRVSSPKKYSTTK